MTDKERVKLLAEKLGVYERSIDTLNEEEAKHVLLVLKEYQTTGYSSYDKYLWSQDYIEAPVSFEVFIEDKSYLGKVGASIYPKWKEDMSLLLHPNSRYIEWILSGAIGIGKSTVANVATAYKLYRLLCLKTPVEYYGLMGDGLTTLAIGLFNLNFKLAYDVNYKQFKAILQTSEWFDDKIKENRGNTWVEVSKDVNIILGSDATHAIGQAVVGGLMDESDFTKSVAYAKPINTYNAIYRRMESRFLKYLHKSPPGLLILISSTVQDDNSFLNQRKKLAEQFPDRTMISEYPQWEIKPIPYELDTGHFRVFVGNELYSPRLLEDNEVVDVDPDLIITVPNLYRMSFQKDLEKSILDLAGRRVGSLQNLFISNPAYIRQIFTESDDMHPFTQMSIPLSLKNDYSLVEFFLKDKFFKYSADKGGLVPRVNSNRERFIHIDLAKTGDAAGIACVHFDQYVKREVFDGTNNLIYNLPRFKTDFVLQIKSVKGSEIDFSKIRDLIIYLVTTGMKLGGVSYDAYQSVESLQQLKIKYPDLDKNKRFITLSMDRTGDPYNYVRSCIIENRHMCYNHTLLIRELSKLKRDPTTLKVDHDSENTKDLSDAWVGATYHCSQFYLKEYASPTPPIVTGINTNLDSTKDKLVKVKKSNIRI